MYDMNQLIKDHLDEFTVQEKKVATNILEFPKLVLVKNISNLSQSIDASRTSITRFCKKIGFNGYTDFKYEYSKYLSEKHNQLQEEHIDITEKTTAYYQEKITTIIRDYFISNTLINELLGKLATKKSIKIIGTGKSQPPALQLKYNLQTNNIYSDFIDSVYFSDNLNFVFNNEDLVIVYSVTGKSVLTNQLVESALNKGADIFFITTTNKSKIDVPKTIVLPNVSNHDSIIHSNHTLFFIFNDLLYGKLSQINKIDC